MSQGYAPEAIDRLVDSSLRDLGRDKWSDLSANLQNYSIYEHFLKGNKRVSIKVGTALQFNVMTEHSESRAVGLMHQDYLQAPNYAKKGYAPWHKRTTNCAYDIAEMAMNSGDSEIYDLVKMQYHGMYMGMFDGIERACWGLPDSATDLIGLRGIPYGITTGATSSTMSNFTGISAAGFSTDVFGINPTTEAKWRNWYSLYSVITDGDLLESMRSGARFTNFKSPGLKNAEYKTGSGGKMYFTNQRVISGITRVYRQNNDALGIDVDPNHDSVTFQRIPFVFVALLEDNTADPVYGIDTSDLEIAMLKGFAMREFEEKQVSQRHTTRAHYLTTQMAVSIRNRRKHQLFAKSNFSNP